MNMLYTTIGEYASPAATDFKAKVYGVARSHRAAILPAGHAANVLSGTTVVAQ